MIIYLFKIYLFVYLFIYLFTYLFIYLLTLFNILFGSDHSVRYVIRNNDNDNLFSNLFIY